MRWFSNSRPPCAVRSNTKFPSVNPQTENDVHNDVYNDVHVIFTRGLDESIFDVRLQTAEQTESQA